MSTQVLRTKALHADPSQPSAGPAALPVVDSQQQLAQDAGELLERSLQPEQPRIHGAAGAQNPSNLKYDGLLAPRCMRPTILKLADRPG